MVRRGALDFDHSEPVGAMLVLLVHARRVIATSRARVFVSIAESLLGSLSFVMYPRLEYRKLSDLEYLCQWCSTPRLPYVDLVTSLVAYKQGILFDIRAARWFSLFCNLRRRAGFDMPDHSSANDRASGCILMHASTRPTGTGDSTTVTVIVLECSVIARRQ
jgi:hypothetical protein